MIFKVKKVADVKATFFIVFEFYNLIQNRKAILFYGFVLMFTQK